MRYFLLMAILQCYATILAAQPSSDSTQTAKYDSLRIARNRWHLIVYYDLHSTFTANAQTWFNQTNPKPQISFYYNLDIKTRLQFRQWLFETGLFSDYGFTWFIDSLQHKTTDHLQYKLSLSRQWHKKISFDVALNTQTILFHGYRFRNNNNSIEPYLNETYMSPGFVYLSGGIGYNLPHQARCHIGLATCKIATLRNSKLYETRQETSIAGIPQGKKRSFEGGINAQVSWPLTAWKERWFAEGTALIFVPFTNKQTTIDINTVLHCKLWRFGRLSWRHQFQWNKAIQPKPSYQQWLTLGCYLNNKL